MDMFTSELIIMTAITVGIILVLSSLLLLYRHLTKKVGPNEALIVFGGRGTRIVVGGSSFVNPITERYRIFSLELMSFSIHPESPLYTAQRIAIEVEANAQVKVRDDPASIRVASEHFLSRTISERETLVRQMIEGNLRHIVGQLTVEDLIKNADHVAQQVLLRAELEKLGLMMVSFTLKHIGGDHIGDLTFEAFKKQEIASYAPQPVEPVSVSTARTPKPRGTARREKSHE